MIRKPCFISHVHYITSDYFLKIFRFAKIDSLKGVDLKHQRIKNQKSKLQSAGKGNAEIATPIAGTPPVAAHAPGTEIAEAHDIAIGAQRRRPRTFI